MAAAKDDLLLRIRLESLNHSFQQMTALADAMTSTNGSIDRLRGLLSGDKPTNGTAAHKLTDDVPTDDNNTLRGPASEMTALNKQLRSVEDLLRSLLGLLKSNADVTPEDFVDQRLETTNVSAATKRLADLAKTIAAVKDEADELWEDMNDWRYLGQRGREHSTDKEFRTAAREVEKLLQDLKSGGQPDPAWESYQTLVATRTPPLFKGFVELASGLTMRGRRLDDRVCAMADDLVLDWAPYYDLSTALTIPAHNDQVWASRDDVQAARMVRLGVAGWTVWSLPLFAGTFWRMYADQEYAEEMADLAPDDESRQRLRTYVGDALAVKMMGPAYACSLILLRLDPAQTDQDGLAAGVDSVRAQVVLNTLKDEELAPWSDIRKLLDGAWTESFARIPAAEPHPDLKFFEPVLTLAQRFEKEFERRVGRMAHVNDRRWKATRELAGQALREQAAGQTKREYRENLTTLLQDLSVVDALNAAWRRRLLPASCDPPAPVPEDQAVEARRIATVLSDHVWPSLQRPSSGAGPIRAGGSRGR